jgi:hypothetical protein
VSTILDISCCILNTQSESFISWRQEVKYCRFICIWSLILITSAIYENIYNDIECMSADFYFVCIFVLHVTFLPIW